jgi:hypothetical protein
MARNGGWPESACQKKAGVISRFSDTNFFADGPLKFSFNLLTLEGYFSALIWQKIRQSGQK